MILSRELKFIFIKGRKVGGTSVEMALSVLCGPADIVTPITPRDEKDRLAMGGRPANYASDPVAEGRYVAEISSTDGKILSKLRAPKGQYFNHMPLSAVLRLAPDAREFPVFFVERNPYAKILSLANWKTRVAAYRTGKEMVTDLVTLREAANRAVADETMFRVRNIDLYRDQSGAIYGTALRYEALADDFASMIRRLGTDDIPLLPHAKKGPLSNRMDPRDFFDRDALNAINVGFAAEFAAFRYQQL